MVQIGGDASSLNLSSLGEGDPTGASGPAQAAGKTKLFLSYVHAEKPVADALKRLIESAFGSGVSVFLAEDPGSVSIGDEWMEKIRAALRSADLLLVLASPASLARPWINIEVGAAWAQGIAFASLCHSGTRRETLPQPYQSRQAYEIDQPEHCEALLAALSKSLSGKELPPLDFPTIALQLGKAIASCQ